MGEPLTVLSADAGDSLPSGADPALATDLATGALVIVPGDPATARAWWTVSPDDGATRAVLSPGFGGVENHVNETPNTGDRLSLPDAKKMTDQQIKKLWNDAMRDHYKAEAEEAAKRAAPRQRCFGGNEYTTTLCISQTAARAIAVGIGIAIVLGILYATISVLLI